MAGAIALACVLASATPAAGEPRLTPQQNHPTQSAGIIPPPPVNPPPRTGTREQTGRVLVWSWPSDGEPRRNQPNPGASRIVPLTLKYGQQPPLSSSVIPAEMAAIRTMWEPPAPPPPFLLKLTASGSVAAPPSVLVVSSHTVELASWSPAWQVPFTPAHVAPLIPASVVVAFARPGVPALIEQPAAAGRATVPISVTVWVASSKPSTPAPVPDVVVARASSVVATLPAPVVSPVAFTRASVPGALEWIAQRTVRVVTQGSTPAAPSPTPYTRALIIEASHAPMGLRAVVGTSGIASLLPPSVVSAPDLALLGTFVQLVAPATVSLVTPSMTVALVVIGATVALTTPDVAAALTSPDARIITAPPQTSRPDL